jgi:glycolate oxidase iron-sulfur subunit
MEKSIKDNIYKCSKCGLCQSVCPVFIATKNEMYLPRGRYNVLNNSFNNNIPLSKKFINDLDICLNCNECKRFCPSNIDSYNIFTQIKSEYNYKYSFIPFSVIYKLFLRAFRIDRYFYKFFPLKSVFVNTIVDSLYDVKVKKIKRSKETKKTNVVYFRGCINKYLNPSDKNATVNILEKLGYNVLKINSSCCGLPYLSDGNIKAFNKNADKIRKQIPEDIEYIVCSCDSCYETLKQTELSSKLIRLDDLLNINNFEIPQNKDVLYHKPINREDKSIVSSYIQEINEKGVCALTENFMLLKHYNIASELIYNNFYKKDKTENKIIVTTCNIAALGLKLGFCITKSNAKVYTLAEYINLSGKMD